MNGPSLIDALDDLFFVFDESRTVVIWNQAALEVTGYSEEELAGMRLTDFFEGANSETVASGVETGDAPVEGELVTADGDRIPYEFSLRQLPEADRGVFAGIGCDITDRVHKRTQLEIRERTLREMYEIIADPQRSFAEQVEALLELGRAELETAYGTFSKIEGDEYVFEVVAAKDDSIQAGDVVPLSATNCEIAASNERTLVLGDVARDAPAETDRAGYVEWGISCYVGAPVFVDDDVYGTFCFYDTEPRVGTFSNWTVTLVDLMSQWVSYELERQRAKDRLRKQNEELEQFATRVSHDLRNPLSVADVSLKRARETGDMEHLEHAHRAIDRMNTLIDDLLMLARSGTVIDETEPVDLRALAEHCWQNVTTDEAELEVETERTVLADKTRLEQLLENLFRNAVEHSDERVTITVADRSEGFSVDDDGPGIPETKRESAFERGYTTTPEGIGFGLAIVKEIADAHGWRLQIGDSPTGGTRFEFTDVAMERANV